MILVIRVGIIFFILNWFLFWHFAFNWHWQEKRGREKRVWHATKIPGKNRTRDIEGILMLDWRELLHKHFRHNEWWFFFFFISGAASNNLCYLLKSDKQPTLRSLLSQVSGRTGTKYSSISIVGYTFDLNFLRLTSAHSSERNTPVHIKGKIKWRPQQCGSTEWWQWQCGLL